MAPGDLTGILLVGGASRRFGSPKALAELDGETLAVRAWRTLGKVCSERFALGKRQDGLVLPFEILDDGSEVRAPIAGVVAGLRAASNDVCIVLPIDLPFIRASHLRALATACADAAVPQRARCPARTAGPRCPCSSAASPPVSSPSAMRSSTWTQAASTWKQVLS